MYLKVMRVTKVISTVKENHIKQSNIHFVYQRSLQIAFCLNQPDFTNNVSFWSQSSAFYLWELPGKSSVSSTLPLIYGKTQEWVGVVSFSKLAGDKNRSPYLVGHPDVKAAFKRYESRQDFDGFLQGSMTADSCLLYKYSCQQ